MKYLIPFVFANNEKIKYKENLFKTNININLVKKDLQYNSPEKFVKEVYLKKSFAGKKILSNLFKDINNKNYFNTNKNKNRKDSPNDSRIKDNKFKSLIN